MKTITKKKVTYKFSYLNKTIQTDFELSEDQEKVLRSLIDFAKNPYERQITLQGAAGTGKTSIIGYLQKYINKKFLYIAPTHAATVELANATVKVNKDFPMTIASATKQDYKSKEWSLSFKAAQIGARFIVIDESSLLTSENYEALVSLSRFGYKIIFLGDKMQLPEVKPGAKFKTLNKCFTEGTILNLDIIHRTSNEDIKAILQNMRDCNYFNLYKIDSAENVKFYSDRIKFNDKLKEIVLTDPLNTDFISYSNNNVEVMNKFIREVIFGRKGVLEIGDVVIGYLGYASKQIDSGNVANSISYVIENIERTEVGYNLKLSSNKINNLREQGLTILPRFARTTLLPLSNDEVFINDFDNTVYQENNITISALFKSLYTKLNKAKENNKSWGSFYELQDKIKYFFSCHDLMGNYIYNCFTNKMEKYDSKEHQKLVAHYGINYKLFIVEKGIDFGHAITIHKAQGKTTKNVFFDASSIFSSGDIPILDKGNQINSEYQALAYVAMSRASENLFVYEGNHHFNIIS